MRYYSVTISDPATGQVITPPGFDPALLGGASYTSFVNNRSLTAAWNVELDIPVIAAGTPQGFAGATIWGVSNDEISQAANLNNKNVSISGGMQRGLPLANPKQAGVLVNGYIFQAYGNNIGTNRTLNLVIAPGPAAASAPGGVGTLAKPRNLVLNWQGGQQLGPALKQCLQTGFPGYTVNVDVSANIVARKGDTPSGFYPTLEQLNQVVGAMSRSIVQTKGYRGVSIVVSGATITASDGSNTPASAPLQINFQDLIGQPTWLDLLTVQIKTVMRADIPFGGQIKLPPTLVTVSQPATSPILNQRPTFQGVLTVTSLRHVGNFRQPTADAWVSVIEGVSATPGGLPQ